MESKFERMAPLLYNLETLNMIQSILIQVNVKTLVVFFYRLALFTLLFFNELINQCTNKIKRKKKYKSNNRMKYNYKWRWVLLSGQFFFDGGVCSLNALKQRSRGV